MAISEYVPEIRRFRPIVYAVIHPGCPHLVDLEGIFTESLQLPTAETGL